jgi:membrane protein implicated in regulation of membrane protease activity
MAGLVGIWWVWLAFAIALGVIEVLLPGFIFLGFALGALVMAALVGLVTSSMTVAMSLAAFAALSLLAWIVLRLAFRRQSSGARRVMHDIND